MTALEQTDWLNRVLIISALALTNNLMMPHHSQPHLPINVNVNVLAPLSLIHPHPWTCHLTHMPLLLPTPTLTHCCPCPQVKTVKWQHNHIPIFTCPPHPVPIPTYVHTLSSLSILTTSLFSSHPVLTPSPLPHPCPHSPHSHHIPILTSLSLPLPSFSGEDSQMIAWPCPHPCLVLLAPATLSSLSILITPPSLPHPVLTLAFTPFLSLPPSSSPHPCPYLLVFALTLILRWRQSNDSMIMSPSLPHPPCPHHPLVLVHPCHTSILFPSCPHILTFTPFSSSPPLSSPHPHPHLLIFALTHTLALILRWRRSSNNTLPWSPTLLPTVGRECTVNHNSKLTTGAKMSWNVPDSAPNWILDCPFPECSSNGICNLVAYWWFNRFHCF